MPDGCAAGFPLLQVTLDADDGFTRGRQHGVAAAAQIARSIETYRRMFTDFVGVDWDEARDIGRAYGPRIDAYDPELRAEISGIAAGAGFDEDDILALNARSEIALSARLVDGCTAFTVLPEASGTTTWLAQNWDWRGTQHDALILLRVQRPGCPQVTMIAEAGIIGKIGWNSAGLGVCLNAIVTDQVDPEGVPLHVVLRAILESWTLGDAVESAGRATIASAANFLVAQHGVGAVDIEATPSRIDVQIPACGVLTHTNHLRSPRLADVRDLAVQALPDSYPRLGRIEALLDRARCHIDQATIWRLLTDHANGPDGICRHEDVRRDPEGKRLETVMSIVMDLGIREAWMAHGHPCSVPHIAIPTDAAAAAETDAGGAW